VRNGAPRRVNRLESPTPELLTVEPIRPKHEHVQCAA
jgi:hypothetical protein